MRALRPRAPHPSMRPRAPHPSMRPPHPLVVFAPPTRRCAHPNGPRTTLQTCVHTPDQCVQVIPIFGPPARVVVNVMPNCVERPVMTDDALIIAALPDSPGSLRLMLPNPCQPAHRYKRLERADHSAQRGPGDIYISLLYQADDAMEVIRYHDPGILFHLWKALRQRQPDLFDHLTQAYVVEEHRAPMCADGHKV